MSMMVLLMAPVVSAFVMLRSGDSTLTHLVSSFTLPLASCSRALQFVYLFPINRCNQRALDPITAAPFPFPRPP